MFLVEGGSALLSLMGENTQGLSGVGAQTILGSSWWLSQSWQLETLQGVQLAAGTVVL